ncbi:hypothetical protein GGI43DRAFT_258885 [Trichoderma evansii]
MNLQSWTQYLTSWISSSTAAWSVRAATLEFYGQQTKQEALCREAERYYAHALQIQQARIRAYTEKPKGDSNKPNEAPTEEDVSASLMLMYYELLRPTFTGSWMTHLRGTVELLILRGAQSCQEGLGHLVFRSLRLLMAHVSIRTQLSPCFASFDWRTVPFYRGQKTALDAIPDAIYKLSLLLKYTDVNINTVSQHGLEPHLQTIVDEVILSEHIYALEIPSQETTWHHFPFNFNRDDKHEDMLWLGGGDFCSLTPSVAYHAVWIMIYHLKLSIPLNNCTTDQAAANESIARASFLLDFLGDLFRRNLHTKLNVGSCIQLVFPMEVVSWYSPCANQRKKARAYLDQLGWMQSF